MTMDPDEALKQLREALDGMHGVGAATVGTAGWLDAVEDLARAAEALDTWMANGGFLPAGWMIHRTAV
jgi:hypothetical protein